MIDHRGGNASAFDQSFGCPDKKKEKRSFRYTDEGAKNTAAEEKTVP